MAYSFLNYIDVNEIENIKKCLKIYKGEEIKKYKDIDAQMIFSKYDYLIEIEDINEIINRSVLKNELEKIEKLRIKFEQENNSMLRERGLVEKDDLVETTDREILNRRLVNNLVRRGLKFTSKDAIYYRNDEDESYNEIKAYYINTTLSSRYNRDFDAISQGLKRAISSKKQSFTIFKTLFAMKDNHRDYVITIPSMTFNNERFTKELYKLFIPFFSLVMAEIIQISIKESDSWSKCGYHVDYTRSEKVVNLESQMYSRY